MICYAEDLIVSNTEIRKTTLRYCVKNLSNNILSKNVQNIAKFKEILHSMRMLEDTNGEFEIEEDEFKDVVEVFKRKDTKSYDFLVKSGKKYQEAIGHLVMKLIKTETFPDEFRKTVLHMIWKGKGAAEVLKNSRFVHMKSFLPRACEAVLVGRMKERILARMVRV